MLLSLPYQGSNIPVTSRFGSRADPLTRKPAGHEGVDFGTPTGTPIQAIYDGSVSMVDWAGDGIQDGNGWAVWLDILLPDSERSLLKSLLGPEEELNDELSCRAVYLHLDQILPGILSAPRRGSVGGNPVPVSKGDRLGMTGSTGRVVGAHLHFGLYVRVKSGKKIAINPLPLFEIEEPQMPRVLHRGLQGDDVKHLQILLGISPADGIFGPQTEAFVKRAQSKKHIAADGWVGPLSRAVFGL